MENIWIVKLYELPIGIKLYEIIDELYNDVTTLVGAHHIYDYRRMKYDNAVFLYLSSLKEFQWLKNQKVINIRGTNVKTLALSWVIVAVKREKDVSAPGSATNKELFGCPATIMARYIPVRKFEKTPMVYRVIKFFELQHGDRFIGVMMYYDSMKRKLRPYAFVGFNSWNLVWSYHNKRIPFEQSYIQTIVSDKTTAIVTVENLNMAIRPANMDTAIINWLNTDLDDGELDELVNADVEMEEEVAGNGEIGNELVEDVDMAVIQAVRNRAVDWLNVKSEKNRISKKKKSGDRATSRAIEKKKGKPQSRISIGDNPGTSGAGASSPTSYVSQTENTNDEPTTDVIDLFPDFDEDCLDDLSKV